MIIRNIALVLTLLVASCAANPVLAEDELIQKGWVSDFANVLSPAQISSLSSRLAAIERTKPDAPQIVVVTYPSLGDKTISDKTIQLAKQWKVGRKERDNGVVIAVAPVERKYFISIGYGLEPSIPDSKTQAIGDKMRQALSKNKTDWNAAIVAAVDQVERLLPIEAYDPANPIKKPVAEPIRIPGHTGWFWIGIISAGAIGTWLLCMFFGWPRKKKSQTSTSSLSSSPYSSYTGPVSTGRRQSVRSADRDRDRSSTAIVPVFIPSSSDSTPSRSSSSSSGSSWSDSSSSSSDSYSSGGGDSGGGGGGGDL